MNALFHRLIISKYVAVFLIIFFTAPGLSSAQKAKIGTVGFLTATNGINGIYLGADIKNLNYSQISYLDGDDRFDADSCLKFAISDSAALRIDKNVSLDMIGIRTYNSKIVNIYLFFRKADAYAVLNKFLSIYGVFTSKPVEYSNIYVWDSAAVNLSLMYRADLDDGVAIFTYNPLVRHLVEVKEMAAGQHRKQYNEQGNAAVLLSSTKP